MIIWSNFEKVSTQSRRHGCKMFNKQMWKSWTSQITTNITFFIDFIPEERKWDESLKRVLCFHLVWQHVWNNNLPVPHAKDPITVSQHHVHTSIQRDWISQFRHQASYTNTTQMMPDPPPSPPLVKTGLDSARLLATAHCLPQKTRIALAPELSEHSGHRGSYQLLGGFRGRRDLWANDAEAQAEDEEEDEEGWTEDPRYSTNRTPVRELQETPEITLVSDIGAHGLSIRAGASSSTAVASRVPVEDAVNNTSLGSTSSWRRLFLARSAKGYGAPREHSSLASSTS